MNSFPLMVACAATILVAQTNAQFSTGKPTPKKVPVLTVPAPTGGFLNEGIDDCAGIHRIATTGINDVATGTTGAEGQSDSACYFFGTSGIDNDVWFDWTATADGMAIMETCGGVTFDSKIAAWPYIGDKTCPVDGTVLACNDDTCSLQSSISWPCFAGSTYTLQIGTFPGATGGTGTFTLDCVGPIPCGQYDDGESENNLGLTAGGEMAWMHYYACLDSVSQVRTAFGTVAAGSGARICIWEDTDCDGDPTTGLVLLYDQPIDGGAVNVDSDALNVYGVMPPVDLAGCCAFVGIACNQLPGEFPGTMDETNAVPGAWVMGSTLGPDTLNCDDVNANNVPPLQMTAIGFPSSWLLRAEGQECGVNPGTPACFCEDTGQANDTPPPCANADPNAGCANGTGSGGLLTGTGSNSVSAGDLVLHVSGATPLKTTLFFQGDLLLGNGAGLPFGDGHRCCGENVRRLQVGFSNLAGSAVTTIDLAAAGAVSPGDIKCYQNWYRDPFDSPCGALYNFTNAYEITWAP